jgi:hypothetical protein
VVEGMQFDRGYLSLILHQQAETALLSWKARSPG